MVEYSFFLSWKPCPDMGIEGEADFDPDILRSHGEDLRKHYRQVAQNIELLKNNGWDYSAGLYDVSCYKEISLQGALAELRQLGFDVTGKDLMEFEDEEWEEEGQTENRPIRRPSVIWRTLRICSPE